MAGVNANAAVGAPMLNPYTASMGAAAANPYSLSTTPSNTNPYSTLPYYPPISYGQMDPRGSSLLGYGYSLQGVAALTSANAQYWKDTQTAALMREGVNQERLNTERRRVELAQWYDTVRPTALRARAQEQATDLDTARRGPADSDILSGRALNTLLGSIQKSGKLSTGPTIPLDEDVVKRVNVAGSTGGNIGLLKDGGKLNWPEAYLGEQFDEPRKRLSRNIPLAVQTLKDGEVVRPDLIRDIRADARTIGETLDETAGDLAPPQYIEARRYLRQLENAVAALGDAKVANYFNNTWQARGKNVADPVTHMTRNGLRFAPATPGDKAAYRAVYQGLRAYEAGAQLAQREGGAGRGGGFFRGCATCFAAPEGRPCRSRQGQ